MAQGSRNSLGDGLSKEEIRRRLYLLHSATGHGPLKHLVQSLKRRGVSSEIIEEAEKFECSVFVKKRVDLSRGHLPHLNLTPQNGPLFLGMLAIGNTPKRKNMSSF